MIARTELEILAGEITGEIKKTKVWRWLESAEPDETKICRHPYWYAWRFGDVPELKKGDVVKIVGRFRKSNPDKPYGRVNKIHNLRDCELYEIELLNPFLEEKNGTNIRRNTEPDTKTQRNHRTKRKVQRTKRKQ